MEGTRSHHPNVDRRSVAPDLGGELEQDTMRVSLARRRAMVARQLGVAAMSTGAGVLRPTMLQIWTGPMFSGKTTAMLRAVEALRERYPSRLLVKSAVDTRCAPTAIVSRDGLEAHGVMAASSLDTVTVEDGMLIACDEAQFFQDGSLLRLWDRVRAARSSALLVSGLDRDFRGSPFGDVMTLAARALCEQADTLVHVERLVSRCHRCGSPAAFTERVVRPAKPPPAPSPGVANEQQQPQQQAEEEEEAVVLVGDAALYQPVCLHHAQLSTSDPPRA